VIQLQTHAPLIMALADPTASLGRVGGKGAALARLASAGLPVPGGFLITTTAYQGFVADNDLERAIRDGLSAADLAQPASLETAARAIAERFSAASMSQAIAGGHRPGVRGLARCGATGSSALFGHRRGPAGALLRRAAGDVSERPRSGRGSGRREALLGLAVDPSRHRLQAHDGDRPGLHSGEFSMTWELALKFMADAFSGKSLSAIRNAIPSWRDQALPLHLRAVQQWKKVDLASMSDEHLLDGIRELARAEALYWSSATLVMAVARGSEMALDFFLSVGLPTSGLHSALFLRGFPSRAIEAEAELQDLAAHVRGSDELRELVLSTPTPRLLDALHGSPAGVAIVEHLRSYLDRYGHRVYDLDFAEPTQSEDPLPVLLSLRTQVQRPGRDVNARRAEMARERDQLIETTARAIDPVRRRLFLTILRWAWRLAPYREEALFYVGSAWPALRRLALELGRRLADVGSLEAPDAVFFLYSDELRGPAESRPRQDVARLAHERLLLRAARKRLHPPAAVPPAAGMKWGPIDLSRFETQRRNVDRGPTLRGFAVSPGRVTAPASVLLSPADFGTMAPDTILVCPTTTPAWTPLFAQARGLVTDIGGIGAHGSIVAREYGIPAVMGTGAATRRIHNGDVITVDGGAGVVTLQEEDSLVE
jgi:phosphohistidine swiveling domain-containing protein